LASLSVELFFNMLPASCFITAVMEWKFSVSQTLIKFCRTLHIDGDVSGNNTPNPNARSEKNAVFQAAFSQKPSSVPGALPASGPSQTVSIMSSPGETSGRKLQYTTPTSVNYSALHTASAPAPMTTSSATAATVPTGVRAAEGIEKQEEKAAGSLEEMDLLS
jgi:hypothetical protein